MERLKHIWSKTPAAVRKPLVLATGSVFIIASVLTGWLPGPGGIPLFLIGIAILSTEYIWARTLRDFVLGLLHKFGIWFRKHRMAGSVLVVITLGGLFAFGTLFYSFLW